MKRLKTLRVRFALWTSGLLLVAFVLFSLFVYANMARQLTTEVDETLRPTVDQLIAEVEIENGKLVLIENPIGDPEFDRLREQGFSFRIVNLAGELIANDGPYADLLQTQVHTTTANQLAEFTTITAPNTQEPVRLHTTPIVIKQQIAGVIQVAQNLENTRHTLNLLLSTLFIWGPLIVIIAGGSGYFLAARALAPIDNITRTAGHISAKDLSARLNLAKSEDEVGRLVATFDSMLARLDNAFQRERQFTADASHELRTPLAAMQTIIGSTLAQPRLAAEYEQALTDLSHEAQQMRALTEGLLHLARNEASRPLAKFEELNLSILLKDVIDSLNPVAEEKGLRLIAHLPDEDLSLYGDSDGLIRLFVNLLDNAIKYTEQGTITVTADLTGTTTATTNDNHSLAIILRDTGRGIAPEHLPHIFDRFYRVDASRSTEGIGLGLAIAQDIAQAHGGHITVESQAGQGTTFTVQLATK